MTERRTRLLIALVLVVMALAIYWPAGHHAFVDLDDDRYVTENPRVRSGLSAEGVSWAFGTLYFSNWHPLTWLSHMADVSAFGLDAGWHHRVSVGLHAVNGVVLFLALHLLTGAVWRSAFVAAVFAVHPLHVESVAWVAERKDVLSTLFFFLALWAYGSFAARGGARRYVAVALCFVLGLLSKPMVVTLPFVLLLLDWWPLGRWSPSAGSWKALGRLLLEKAPLFALSAASCAVTYAAQAKEGAVGPWESLSLGPRVWNAIASYGGYAWKAVWPSSLAVYYPHPGAGFSWGPVAAGGLFLLGMSYLSWRERGRRPYLAVGWLWYVGTLVPVIGLVQVGGQALADRYTYVPLTGLLVMAAWGIPELVPAGRVRERAVPAVAAAAVMALGIGARHQLGYWQDSGTLFGRALEVTRGNWMAHYALGVALHRQGKVAEAIAQYEEALRLSPTYDKAHNALGTALLQVGRADEATRHFMDAVRASPRDPVGYYNLGIAFWQRGRTAEAAASYREALVRNPEYLPAHVNLGNLQLQAGRTADAVAEYRAILSVEPGNALAHYNLGVVLAGANRDDEAIAHYRAALLREPNYAAAHANLGVVLERRGAVAEAISEYRLALRYDPADALSHENLATALLREGRAGEAADQFREALRLRPDSASARDGLARALGRTRPGGR